MTSRQQDEFFRVLQDWFEQDFDLDPGQWGDDYITDVEPHRDATGLVDGLIVHSTDGGPFLLTVDPTWQPSEAAANADTAAGE